MKKTVFLIIMLFITAISIYGLQPGNHTYKVDYWVVNGHGGIAYPLGTFSDFVNPSYNFGVSARKGFDMEFSAGGGISLVNMPYKTPGAPGPFQATVIDIEGAYAPYVPDFFIWPYAKFGIGAYLLKYSKLANKDEAVVASETSIGFLFGGGANYPINNTIAINAEVLYNHVSLGGGTGDVNTFLTLNGGITVFLK